MSTSATFCRARRASTAIEYAAATMLISVVSLVGITIVGQEASQVYCTIAGGLSGNGNCASASSSSGSSTGGTGTSSGSVASSASSEASSSTIDPLAEAAWGTSPGAGLAAMPTGTICTDTSNTTVPHEVYADNASGVWTAFPVPESEIVRTCTEPDGTLYATTAYDEGQVQVTDTGVPYGAKQVSIMTYYSPSDADPAALETATGMQTYYSDAYSSLAGATARATSIPLFQRSTGSPTPPAVSCTGSVTGNAAMDYVIGSNELPAGYTAPAYSSATVPGKSTMETCTPG